MDLLHDFFSESLKPKVRPHKSLEEANKEIKKIEEEMMKVISGKAPELASMLKNSDRQSPIGNNTLGMKNKMARL